MSIVVVGAVGFAVEVAGDASAFSDPLTYVLAAVALVSALLVSNAGTNAVFSPAFMCDVLAIGLVGAAAGYIVPLVAELGAWLVLRYRREALLINIAGIPTPTFFVAVAFAAASLRPGSLEFYVGLAVASVAIFALNVGVVLPLMAILDGRPISLKSASLTELLPPVVISALLAIGVAAAYEDLGTPALAFLLVVVSAAAYMLYLVAESREKTRQYANLSWGVLSALVRTLNERDHRAARHCAAVAMFSRDMARAAGLDERDQELAHTAGLLHDIGKFVLSDRVMERGAQLNEGDWRGIRRHPDIGADLLKDIGVFGPIGDIIRAHHERIDGRGYPSGLTGDDIPEVAKIVAVAEVYDTLTAPDTYRTPMTSFEALTELRRVAGEQLEGSYVEALSELLAGRGTDYRHQDEADFDRELDMERRMSEAASPA